MLRKFGILFLSLIFLLTFSISAFAVENPKEQETFEISAETLLEKGRASEKILSRGAFATMLAYASGISEEVTSSEMEMPADLDKESWFAGDVMALYDKNILRGFSGNVYPDRAITGIEAAALVGRTLGLPEDMKAPDIEVDQIEKGHWGFNILSWMLKEDLIPENMEIEGNIDPETAADIIVKAFGTHQQAKAIVENSNEKNNEIESFRAGGEMTVNINMAGLNVPAESVEMSMEYEMEYNNTALYQKTNFLDPISGQTISMEQYMDKNYIYTLTNSEDGEPKWKKIKNTVPQLFEEDMFSKQQFLESYEDPSYYRLLGKETIDGREYYKIAMYLKIDDFNDFIEKINDFDMGQTQGLEGFNDLIKSISVNGVLYIDVENSLPEKININAFLALNEEFQQESPVVLKSVNMNMNYEYYDFNEDIVIDIPEEAKNADELDLNDIPEETDN